MKIVGITGKKRHGKDTAAAALVVDGFTKVRFADPLKLMLGVLLRYQGVDEGTVERMIEGDLKEVPTIYLQGQTPRWAMQSLGTEWGRNLIGDGLWTDALRNRAMQCQAVVVSDMRFPNEVALVQQMGGVTMRIVNPNVADNSASEHPSETQIASLPVDYEIVNDGTIADLHDQVRVLA